MIEGIFELFVCQYKVHMQLIVDENKQLIFCCHSEK